MERRSPISTWVWFMTLIFLPLIGFFLFIFFGQNFRKDKRLKVKKAEERFQKSIGLQELKLESNDMAFYDPKVKYHKDLIHLNLSGNKALFTQDNKVEIYIDGHQKFTALIESLESAQKYIHLEYYIFRSDRIGSKILEILERKASEGIEVKFLYDAIGGINLSSYFFTKLKKNGGHVASFFPSFLYYFNLRINYRNHRKIAIIDGKEAFVGGFNIGDEYLGKAKKFGFWRDTHLKIKGSAINALQRQFLFDWKFASKEPMKFDRDYYYPVRKPQGKTGIQIVSSGPDLEWTSIKDGYFKIITSARKKIYIQTPYFVPDESILEALRVAAIAGIDVKIIIPNKPDQIFVYWASYSYVGDLLDAGIKFYIYDKGFIHSKMIIADGVIGSVGSANMDIRSFHLNFEINAFIYDQETIQQLEEYFINDLKDCTEITQEVYSNRSIKIRLKESVSRLFSALL